MWSLLRALAGAWRSARALAILCGSLPGDPILGNQRRSHGRVVGWGGAFGTRSYSDPEEQLTAVLMLQL